MSTNNWNRHFEKRIESLQRKIRILSSLRKILNLPKDYDLTERQWSVLNSQLVSLERRFLLELSKNARKNLPFIHQLETARRMNSVLGRLELELTRAFVFFDTFQDILTQRCSAELGKVLAGCDVIALDGLRKNHPALKIVEAPVVYFDRGFGASILRTGVPLPTGIKNELPLIQVPYNRIRDKCSLSVGILHEAAHEALVRLNIVSEIPRVLYNKLAAAGAPTQIRQLFSLWTRETCPDFVGWLGCGIAQTAGIREILSLPTELVLKVSFSDPHPPPYLRVLQSFEWCKTVWGRGLWNRWEEEWLTLYPLEKAPLGTRRLLSTAQQYFPVVNDVLFHTKFTALNGKTLPSLFDLNALDPRNLQRKLSSFLTSGRLNLTETSPSTQIAIFALIKEKGILSEETLDKVMTQWFIKLAHRRNKEFNSYTKSSAILAAWSE